MVLLASVQSLEKNRSARVQETKSHREAERIKSDRILEAKSQNQRTTYHPHGGGIERSDVFHESVFGDGLKVVEFHERLLREICLAAKRNLGWIARPTEVISATVTLLRWAMTRCRVRIKAG